MSFKDPSFQDRTAAAAEAKKKALDSLRAKPALDPQVVAERAAAREAKEAAERAKRDAKRAAEEQAKREKAEAKAAAEAAALAAKEAAKPKPIMTEEQRKALRDARYAARKARK